MSRLCITVTIGTERRGEGHDKSIRNCDVRYDALWDHFASIIRRVRSSYHAWAYDLPRHKTGTGDKRRHSHSRFVTGSCPTVMKSLDQSPLPRPSHSELWVWVSLAIVYCEIPKPARSPGPPISLIRTIQTWHMS